MVATLKVVVGWNDDGDVETMMVKWGWQKKHDGGGVYFLKLKIKFIKPFFLALKMNVKLFQN